MDRSHNELLEIAVQYTKHRYSNLAALLGCSKQSVHQMRTLNRVPERYWPKFESITNGKVKESHFRRSAERLRA